jgi:uncharacterized protein (TIGR02284 family)
MENNKETIETLNDLILINNDRIADYEKAIKELSPEDTDLTTLFGTMIDESRKARMELGKEVQVLGGEMAEGTMTSGKIYRAWMDVKALFTGHDRASILANCEAGEDAAQKAYDSALEEEELPDYLREIIIDQQLALKYSLDEIRSLRNETA